MNNTMENKISSFFLKITNSLRKIIHEAREIVQVLWHIPCTRVTICYSQHHAMVPWKSWEPLALAQINPRTWRISRPQTLQWTNGLIVFESTGGTPASSRTPFGNCLLPPKENNMHARGFLISEWLRWAF